MTLKIGDKINNITLPINGKNVPISEFKGSKIILFFYPKDNTPGCSIESQDFSNNLEKFNKKKCIIFGISADSLESHQKFINKYNLKVELISDSEKELCKFFGVLKEKSMFGKKYIGIERTTFLIDDIGKITKIWKNVKVKGHVQEVLDSINL